MGATKGRLHYYIICRYLLVKILSTEQFNNYTKCDTDNGQGNTDLAPAVMVVMVLLGSTFPPDTNNNNYA